MMTKKAKTTAATKRAPKASARSQGARLGRKPVPENESRHDRFMRLGTKRMNNAIRQIQLLGNLCSPNYECTADDIALMRDTINRELDMALARFSPRKRNESAAGFSFGKTAQPTQH